jgi:hypothetical protein
MDHILEQEYYSGRAGSLTGVSTFARTVRKKYPHIKLRDVKKWLEQQSVYQDTNEYPARLVNKSFPSAFTIVAEPRFLLVLDSMYLPTSGVSRWPGGGRHKFLIVGVDAATGEVRIEPTTSLRAWAVIPAVGRILERFTGEQYYGGKFNQVFRCGTSVNFCDDLHFCLFVAVIVEQSTPATNFQHKS